MRRLAVFSLAFLSLLLVTSCESRTQSSDETYIDIKLKQQEQSRCLEFNQALLRECVAFLSKRFAVDIRLSPALDAIDDLSVDCDFRDRNYTLAEILARIIAFVEKEHGLSIKMMNEGETIVLDLK